VILGEHNLNVKEGSEIEFRIHTAIKHPKYNKKTVDSDIAMLK
jgi:serine protease 56